MPINSFAKVARDSRLPDLEKEVARLREEIWKMQDKIGRISGIEAMAELATGLRLEVVANDPLFFKDYNTYTKHPKPAVEKEHEDSDKYVIVREKHEKA